MTVLGGLMLTLAYGAAAAGAGSLVLVCLIFTLWSVSYLLDTVYHYWGVCRRFTLRELRLTPIPAAVARKCPGPADDPRGTRRAE